MDLVKKIKIIEKLIINRSYNKALRESNSVLKKDFNNIYILNFYGLSLQGLNEINESIKYFKKAIEIKKDFLAAINNLANSYKAIGEIDLARKAYEQILSINKKYIPALSNYAKTEYEFNNHNKSLLLFKELLDLDKNSETTLFFLASIEAGKGNFDQAKKYYTKILNLNPKNASAHKSLSGIIKYDNENKDSILHINKMIKISKNLSEKKEFQSDIFFALGKAHEDIKDFDKAFSYLDKGNLLKNKSFNKKDIEKHNSLLKNLQLFFSNYEFEGKIKKKFSRQMIFICGLPRSGTTLVEQILAAHSEVTTAGELSYLTESINKFVLKNSNDVNLGLLEKVLCTEDVQHFYAKGINNYKINTSFLIDKAPTNFKWIGFIKLFFANAKVIYVKRNAEDNCLSLFKNSFKSNALSWTYNQKNIANYYMSHMRLMNVFKKKLPNFIYELKYENLVKNKYEEIEKILKFCKLEWDENCLNHHKQSKTLIKTASMSQARNPIYKSSVDLSNNYKKHLREMFDVIKNNDKTK
jgi:Flp pilus assembly protein TadD